jgi:hypothetical protein
MVSTTGSNGSVSPISYQIISTDSALAAGLQVGYRSSRPKGIRSWYIDSIIEHLKSITLTHYSWVLKN